MNTHQTDDGLPPEIVFEAPDGNEGFALETDEEHVAGDAAAEGQGDASDDTGASDDQAAAEGESEAAKPKIERTDAGFRIGDDEIPEAELLSLIDAGRNVSEKEKAATLKFQEAAEIRRTYEEEPQWVAMRQAVDVFAAMPPEVLESVLTYAAEAQEAAKGGKPVPARPTPAGGLVPAGATIPTIPWDQMSEEMQAVVGQFAPMVNELQGLKAQLAQQGLKIDEFGKVIPDVTKHVQTSREERLQTSAITEIKTLGFDVTPADLQAAMKATGVPNPKAAWLSANAAKLIDAGARTAQETARTKPLNTPAAKSRTYDPSQLTADEIFRRQSRGEVPINS